MDDELDLLEMRTKISQHRLRLARIQREARDLKHEKSFLEKAIQLKQGQKTMQDGQVRLSKAELEDKAKEIAMYKRQAPRTLQRYNQLVETQREMQSTLNSLHQRSEKLVESRDEMVQRIHALTVGDLVEKHARDLPEALGGALRKSAAALVPFFDYLAIAADTNNRLVDHVGMEIDRYTHVNIAESPFMSGMVFYCVLLIPLVTVITLGRRLANSSTSLTPSHCIIFANLYFIFVSLASVIASLILHCDVVTYCYLHYERAFIVANLCLALHYLIHVILLGLQSALTMDQIHAAQLVATLSVGLHYFLCTWRKVFTDSVPVMFWFNYVMYATVFGVILYQRFDRLTSRQIDENAVYGFIHRSVQTITEKALNLPDFETVTKTMKRYFAKLSASPRRYSKRQDRVLVVGTPRKRDRRYVSESDEERGKGGEGFWGMIWGEQRKDWEEQEKRERRRDKEPREGREGREGRRKSRRAKNTGFSFWKWS